MQQEKHFLAMLSICERQMGIKLKLQCELRSEAEAQRDEEQEENGE